LRLVGGRKSNSGAYTQFFILKDTPKKLYIFALYIHRWLSRPKCLSTYLIGRFLADYEVYDLHENTQTKIASFVGFSEHFRNDKLMESQNIFQITKLYLNTLVY